MSENALAAVKSRGKSQACGSTSSTMKTDMECWKCGKKGHIKADCRSKAKKKDKKGDNKKGSASANAATEGKDFAFTPTFTGTELVLGASAQTVQETDVYDSGTSGHMLLSRHHFTTFKEITPQTINTMDKTIFQAIGIGNMRVGIPNGKTITYVTLGG